MTGIPEVFVAATDLGHALGARDIKNLPGCWEHHVDDHWWIAINGHGESTKSSKGDDVPPYTVYVEFNGWPAGIVDAHAVVRESVPRKMNKLGGYDE